MGVCGRVPLLTLAAVAGCGRLGFAPGGLDANGPGTDAISDATSDAALCPVIDEHFDTTLGSPWVPYSAGGGSTPAVTNGALVLDVPTAVSTSSVGVFTFDLQDAVVTVTARNFPYNVYGSQVYAEVTAESVAYAMLTLPDFTTQGYMVARIQTGPAFDDVKIPIPLTTAVRFRIATAPDSGGTVVVWSYALSETTPFIEARRMVVSTSFAAADFGATYQVYQTAPSDPPPIQIDDYQVAHPCM